MYLRPESVREDQIIDPECKPVDWNDPNLDFAQYSNTGVVGTPIYASRELGAKLWEAVVDCVALIFKDYFESAVFTPLFQKFEK